MTALRLRHPKGVSNIEVDLDNATVLELQHIIFSSTEILPSQQDLKCGYPPRTLMLIPELPISSLGIQKGDQLIVNVLKGTTATTTAQAPTPAVTKSTTVKPPPTPAKPVRSAATSNQVESVPVPGGVLIHRVVPDDNSCLFTSIGVIFEQGQQVSSKLRQVAADAIRGDPVTWNEAVLGHPRDQYVASILKPSTWGGAIELSVFSSTYRTEICSIDVETGRVDRFGSEHHYSNRCFVLYSGIHYDAVSLAPSADAPPEFHETVFSASNDAMVDAAGKLAGKLRDKKAFTNTATFDLKCGICQKGLKGEKEARAHAGETGHAEFVEWA